MPSLERLNLSLEAFIEWLCAYEGVAVGRLGSWLCSPLVSWLSDTCGYACWIDHQQFGPLAHTGQTRLPEWAQTFLSCTERYGGWYEATGVQVFDILADIERRSSCPLLVA